jgi:DNA-binding transcriptional LysR family regulator
MKTSQIDYFLTLCEDLNFTKAAERCGVAQSTLTRAIKLLEREFGGPLLRRERANTHLTELGCMIRPYLLEVKKHTDKCKAAGPRSQELAKGQAYDRSHVHHRAGAPEGFDCQRWRSSATDRA